MMNTMLSASADFDRRRLLKGMTLGAGATLLDPLVSRLAAEAVGDGPSAPRFLFVLEGNGLPPTQVHPVGLEFIKRERREKTTVQSLNGLELPASLQPVEAFRDRLTVVQGLSGRVAAGGHSNDQGALGVYNAADGRNLLAPTIDAVLGQRYPGVFSNVVLGVAADANESVIFNCSVAGPRRGLPTICKPDIAFERLFGSVAQGDAAAGFAAKRHLLDYLRDDVRQVRNRVGSVDREKLDGYLQAYETMGRTTQRLVETRDRISRAAPVADDKYESDVETDRLDAHFEMAAAAMIGGLTNVCTIASGVGFPYFNMVFGGLGITTPKHSIGHNVIKNDVDATTMAVMIRSFHFRLIARFLQALDDVPEGNGTMLDNTVVVYLSDAAEAHHSQCWEWPFVIIGDLNGKLRTRECYVTYPNYGLAGHRTINTLYSTLLHASGIPCDNFGRPDTNLDRAMMTGTLGELLA